MIGAWYVCVRGGRCLPRSVRDVAAAAAPCCKPPRLTLLCPLFVLVLRIRQLSGTAALWKSGMYDWHGKTSLQRIGARNRYGLGHQPCAMPHELPTTARCWGRCCCNPPGGFSMECIICFSAFVFGMRLQLSCTAALWKGGMHDEHARWNPLTA